MGSFWLNGWARSLGPFGAKLWPNSTLIVSEECPHVTPAKIITQKYSSQPKLKQEVQCLYNLGIMNSL